MERRTDGYKAHLIAEPDTRLITGSALTRASGHVTGDSAVGIELLTADDSLPASPVQVLADSAYGTGAMLAALADAGAHPGGRRAGRPSCRTHGC